MAVADVLANLRLNISDFSAGLKSASKQMGSFAKTMNKQYGDASQSLTKHNIGLKDTARIVQGILVAQTFYTGARAIREATSAVWDFNKSLDYANVTYTALFGDAKLASNFMSVLKEHAVETIFDYQDLADASKKMLAYGIEYKNLMFIMEGLTNLGAMSGDTAALDRISLALGQIYTRGKLTAEEMRQLANAYVPISDIIKEKFNLTPDEMGKVGKLNLPAGEVINAIVDYANERFASVGDAAMYTITGLQNKIVDTLKVVGVEMMTPLTTAYKSFLAYIANGLEAVRNEFATRGVGGIFEYFVPDPNTQQMIRQFLANLHNMFMSVASVGVVAGQVFGNFAHAVVSALNVVMPVLTWLTNALAATLNAILSTRTGAAVLRVALLGAAAAFAITRTYALGALVMTAVTKAVMGLSKALILLASIIVNHPIIALLALLGVTIAGISTASNNANSGLNKLFDTITGASGLSSDDILQGTDKNIKDASGAIEDFNDRFEDGAAAAGDMADGIGDVGKAADKAKKKAGLLSFDEVFKLNEPSDSASAAGAGVGDISDAIENLASGLGSLGSALIPDIPDFSDFLNDFTDGLFGGLKDSILAKVAAFGLGAWLANALVKALSKFPVMGFASVAMTIAKALLRAISGAFIGLALDTVASQFTEKLWQTLEDALDLSDTSSRQAKLGATIGSGIGGAIGMLAGGLPGSLIGAAIGHLAGGIVGLLWDEIGGALSNSIAGLGAGIASALAKAAGIGFGGLVRAIDWSTLSSAFTGIGAVFKNAGLKAIAKGGIIGMAIGFITDGIAALLWNTLAEKFNLGEGAEETAKVGQTIGSVIGTVIGGILGGPAGALLGSAIGTFAGGLVGLFWDKVVELFSNPDVGIGTSIGTALGMFFGPVGMVLGSVVGTAVGAFWDDITAAFSEMCTLLGKNWTTHWTQVGENWSVWRDQFKTDWQEYWAGVGEYWTTWFADNLEYLLVWLEDTKTSWSTAYDEIKNSLSTWWSEVKSSFATKQAEILSALSTWWTTTQTSWSARYSAIKSDISAWWTGVKSDYATKQQEILSSLSTWFTNTKTTWSTKYGEIKSNLSAWWSGVKNDFSVSFGEMLTTTTNKLNSIKTEWSNKWKDIKTEFGNWWKGLKTDMGNWLEDYVWKPIADFFNIDNFWNRIKGLLDAIKARVKSWWSGVSSIFSSAGSVSTSSGSGGGYSFSKTNNTTGGWTEEELEASIYDPKKLSGHAAGGIFNREHIARFAENNKAEAIIPLENASAMQPFVNAISDGILQGLMPVMLANNSGQNDLPPMYVGTLIADDRGLRQLYKKFEVIEAQEAARKGFA